MLHPQQHIPDRFFGWLSGLGIFLTWGMIVWFYPDLPTQIPTHFGPTGQPDAFGEKSWWLVTFPGMLQLAISGLFIWLYHHPQYSNIPSTVIITAMPEPWRSALYRVIRHFLVVLLVLMTLVFAEITLATIGVGLGVYHGLDPWLLGSILVVMCITIGWYTWLMTRLAKAGAAALRSTSSTPSARRRTFR